MKPSSGPPSTTPTITQVGGGGLTWNIIAFRRGKNSVGNLDPFDFDVEPDLVILLTSYEVEQHKIGIFL